MVNNSKEKQLSALDTQEAGNHYKGQKVQPIELAYYLGGTPAFCKLAKYISRDKDDKAEDLRKAYHCIQLEEQLQYFAKKNYKYEDWEFVLYWLERFSSNSNIQKALKALTRYDYEDALYWTKNEATDKRVDLDAAE